MKTSMRWVMVTVIGLASAPYAAYATGPMSNGVGDGEANVPFAMTPGAGEHGRVRKDRARGGAARAKVAGRSPRAADRGARSEDGAELAPQGEADQNVEQLIWTAP